MFSLDAVAGICARGDTVSFSVHTYDPLWDEALPSFIVTVILPLKYLAAQLLIE